MGRFILSPGDALLCTLCPCNSLGGGVWWGVRRLPGFKSKETEPKEVNTCPVNGIGCMCCGTLGVGGGQSPFDERYPGRWSFHVHTGI